MMRFKIDENLPTEVALLLRESGHDASTVYEEKLAGAGDGRILQTCGQEGRTLVSLDLDSADIRWQTLARSPGVIVIRAAVQEVEHVLRIIAGLMPLFAKEPLAGNLWVVDERRVRIRSYDAELD